MFEKITGRCQLKNSNVEIMFVAMNKGKARSAGSKIPVRCAASADCPRSAFCKFVNPLTNRIPVDFGGDPAQAV